MTDDRIRLILFDWDGVICDSLAVFRSIFARINAESATEAESFRALMLQRHVRGEPLLPGRLSDYAEDFAECDLYPGMKELLLDLRREEIRLAVVSTSPFRTIDLLLHRHGLAGVFDAVYSSDDACCKPDLELLHLISEKFRIPEEQTLFVGDQVSDVLFVRTTRYVKRFVTYGFHPEAALREAVRVTGLTGEIFFDTSQSLSRELRALVGRRERGM